MEILHLMAILLLTILVILIGSKVIFKDDYAVVEGTIESGSASIPYPSGFTKDNCIIVKVMFRNATESSNWNEGGLFDSASYVAGAVPYKIQLGDSSIMLTTVRILIGNQEMPSRNDITVNKYYKLVLLKID